MRIDILSAVPELLESPFSHSIIKIAKEKKLVEIVIHNIRDYSKNKYKKIDDYPFGGGSGMILMIEPIYLCISKLKEERSYDDIIYLTPDGETLNQKISNNFSTKENIIILCGHYKGIDQRIRDSLITKEISIGDYVISGGELASAIFVDSIIRLIPGVLGDETSALTDSFQDNFLPPPIYTRPENFKGLRVPEILLSGNHKKIEEWRREKSEQITKSKRPDLFLSK